jgi:plastocyanin domain-containing protein
MRKLAFLTICFIVTFPSFYLDAQTSDYQAKIEDGIQKVQITATEYSFTPNRISVKVNMPVELSVRKEAGLAPHNITLKAPEADIDFSESLSTEPITIKFTPTKAGEYTFFCNKKLPFSKSHREKGMEGILIVRE